VLSTLIICTVIFIDDGALRDSTNCTFSLYSLTLYVDWVNDTAVTTKSLIEDIKNNSG